MAILFKIPRLKLAHNEQGFFSFRMSKTISLMCDVSSKKGISREAQISFIKDVSKNSS